MLEQTTVFLGVMRGLVVIAMLAVGIYWFRQSRWLYSTFNTLGIPGPCPESLVGNTVQAFKYGFCHAITNWTKEYGKVFGLYLSVPTLIVSDPDLVQELTVGKFEHFCNRTPQAFFDYSPWKNGLVSLKDDHWKHVRKLLSPVFSDSQVRKVTPSIDKVIQNVTKYLQEQVKLEEKMELQRLALDFSIDVIARTAFGLEVDSLANPTDPFKVRALELLDQTGMLIPLVETPALEDYNSFFNIVYQAVTFPAMTPVFRRIGINLLSLNAAAFFGSIVWNGLAERRRGRKNYSDFLQLLVESQRAKQDSNGHVDSEIDHSDLLTTSSDLAENNHVVSSSHLHYMLCYEQYLQTITGNILLFLFSAYQPVANAMSFTLYYIAANPYVLIKAQEEVDAKLGKDRVTYDTAMQLTYLDMCIMEAIRLFPPCLFLDRQCGEDVLLGGTQVKKEFRILVPTYCMNRDPQYWSEPEKYDPERHTPEAKAGRHPFLFLPFGAGPRCCVGMKLGQLEIRMVIATILQKFTPVLCEDSVYPPVLNIPETQVQVKDGLWVKFSLRDQTTGLATGILDTVA